jgi:hypothetical protein
MTIECAASALRIACRIDLKNDTRDFAPVGVICFGAEKTRICDGVLLIIGSQRRLVWRHIDNFGMERRHYRKLLRPRSFDRANAGCNSTIFSLAGHPVYRFLNRKD